jgi:hypothetical protein
MNKGEIVNAKISSTTLGYEDRGILTCYLGLDYVSGSQLFGGYVLDTPIKVDGVFSHREGTAYGMIFIQKILETLEVDSWEKLKGIVLRVKCDHNKVYAIGHFMKDKWFSPEDIKVK